MKKRLIILVVFLMSSLAFAAQEPEDFRGIKWGADISGLNEMVEVSSGSGFLTYLRKGDENKIGQADVESIRYHFYKDKFFGSTILFSGYDNFIFLKAALFEKYGAVVKKNRYIEDYTWKIGSVWIMFSYSDVSKKGRVFYYYVPLWTQLENDRKSDAKKAKDGL